MFVIQILTLREPRNETTMRLFVVSVATKPVTSVLIEFSNSVKVFVFAACTKGQFPFEQVSLVSGESLLSGQ
jgi:hypothetical protein